MDDILHDDKLDAVICVAGGWAGGNAASKRNNSHCLYYVNYTCNAIFHFAEFVTNCDLMWKQSVWTSVLASRLASRHLSR